MTPILLCWPMTSEADVCDMTVEVEPSHQYSFKFCCNAKPEKKTTFFLQHDNARPQTLKTVQHIVSLGWTLVPHPPYSQDLAPSDSHLFGPMKDGRCGQHFLSNDRAVRRGEFRPRQTRQLPRAVDLKGRLLSCQSH